MYPISEMRMGPLKSEEPSNWDSNLDCYCYRKLSAEEVDIKMQGRATEAILFASADLGIAPPAVVWLRPSAPVDAASALGRTAYNWADECHAEFARVRVRIPAGYTPWPEKLREVWILSEVSRFPALEFVAVHEVRHVWQKAKDISLFGDVCRAEGDAYPYSYGALRRYLMAKGHLTQELELEIATLRESACRAYAQAWPNGKFATLEN
ncbi:MAG: hypothetical protein NTW28_27700 [Candidatus Solibacter sp.]|nr:hypothetical protein [Candidatus Solibacter sp.]